METAEEKLKKVEYSLNILIKTLKEKLEPLSEKDIIDILTDISDMAKTDN